MCEIQISGTVRKRNGETWVVFDDSDSKKAGLKEGQSIKILGINRKKRISSFGKYPFLKPIERDRDF